MNKPYEYVLDNPPDVAWEFILQIMEDCEAIQSGNDSEWRKDREKINAYNKIAELLKKESN